MWPMGDDQRRYAASTGATSSERLEVLRRELRRRGLPLVLESGARRRGLLARCAPALLCLLVVTVSIGYLDTLFVGVGDEDLSAEDPRAIAGSVALMFAVASPLVWWISSLVLRRLPRVVGTAVSLAAIVALATQHLLPALRHGPAVPERLGMTLLVLAAAYWGMGTMLRWAARRAWRELDSLGPMISRVIPLLMLTMLFFFYNAEIWQVAAQLTMQRTWAAVAVIALLSISLAAGNANDELGRMLEDHAKDPEAEAHPVRRAERFNVLLVSVLVTMIQVTLLAILVFVGFLAFGALSITEGTATQWIGKAPAQFEGFLAILPNTINRPMVQVCLVLAGLGALSFVASAGADPAYRTNFVEPVLREMREGLDVCDAYVAARHQCECADQLAAEQRAERQP